MDLVFVAIKRKWVYVRVSLWLCFELYLVGRVGSWCEKEHEAVVAETAS